MTPRRRSLEQPKACGPWRTATLPQGRKMVPFCSEIVVPDSNGIDKPSRLPSTEPRECVKSSLHWLDNDASKIQSSDLVKIAPASRFEANDRWDVTRFWSDDELVSLGEKEAPIERSS